MLNKPFENVSCQGRIQNFFQEGGTKFRHFFQHGFVLAELILNNLNSKNDSRGSRGMLPRKKFGNLHTAMALIVLFEQFLEKVCHIFGL